MHTHTIYKVISTKIVWQEYIEPDLSMHALLIMVTALLEIPILLNEFLVTLDS